MERAVGDIPLPYRLADSMRSVLFRANTSGLIPAFKECGILNAANFIQLQALLDAGELWQHILLRVVGLDREDVNYYRLLHLIGWPEDNTNGPSLDDSQSKLLFSPNRKDIDPLQTYGQRPRIRFNWFRTPSIHTGRHQDPVTTKQLWWVTATYSGQHQDTKSSQ